MSGREAAVLDMVSWEGLEGDIYVEIRRSEEGVMMVFGQSRSSLGKGNIMSKVPRKAVYLTRLGR